MVVVVVALLRGIIVRFEGYNSPSGGLLVGYNSRSEVLLVDLRGILVGLRGIFGVYASI